MRTIITAFNTCPKFLNWLLFTSFGILLLKILVLDKIPQLFPKAHDVGEMVNDILIANIAGYIFYILSTEIPKVLETRRKGSEIIDWAERAAYNVTGFLQMLYNNNMPYHLNSERILDINSVTLDTVKKEFSLVSPIELAPMSDGFKDGDVAPQLSWLGAMVTHDSWSRKIIKKIWRRYPSFDATLSSYLIQIESSRHSAGMQQDREFTLEFIKKGGVMQNSDLTTWANNYYDCYESARELIKYCKWLRSFYSIN